MPHVVIHCFKAAIPAPGLERIGREIADLLVRELGCSAAAVSVDLEQVEPERWQEQVYLPSIAPRLDGLIRTPLYVY